MPDSVEIPAPLSTSTPPARSASATGAVSVVPGGRSSAGVQLKVGRMRIAQGYETADVDVFTNGKHDRVKVE